MRTYYVNGVPTLLNSAGTGLYLGTFYMSGRATSLSHVGTGSFDSQFYVNGLLTTLPASGNGLFGGTYYLAGQATTLDKNGTGLWNGLPYLNGVLSCPTPMFYGYCQITGKFYFAGVESTLNSQGDGTWSGRLYVGGYLFSGYHTDGRLYGNGIPYSGYNGLMNSYFMNGEVAAGMSNDGTGFYQGWYYYTGKITNLKVKAESGGSASTAYGTWCDSGTNNASSGCINIYAGDLASIAGYFQGGSRKVFYVSSGATMVGGSNVVGAYVPTPYTGSSLNLPTHTVSGESVRLGIPGCQWYSNGECATGLDASGSGCIGDSVYENGFLQLWSCQVQQDLSTWLASNPTGCYQPLDRYYTGGEYNRSCTSYYQWQQDQADPCTAAYGDDEGTCLGDASGGNFGGQAGGSCYFNTDLMKCKFQAGGSGGDGSSGGGSGSTGSSDGGTADGSDINCGQFTYDGPSSCREAYGSGVCEYVPDLGCVKM